MPSVTPAAVPTGGGTDDEAGGDPGRAGSPDWRAKTRPAAPATPAPSPPRTNSRRVMGIDASSGQDVFGGDEGDGQQRPRVVGHLGQAGGCGRAPSVDGEQAGH